jgi:hypothetical protein
MKTVEQMVEVMQHFAFGGEVEYFTGSEWRPVEEPTWNWSKYDYRIKVIEAEWYWNTVTGEVSLYVSASNTNWVKVKQSYATGNGGFRFEVIE